MSSLRASCQQVPLMFRKPAGFLRRVSAAMLCLSYLVTNTGMIPQLSVKPGCRCGDQQKSTSNCCCVNKIRSAGQNSKSSCCSSRESTTRSCCTSSKGTVGESSDAETGQLSRLCGCGSSQLKGYSVADPRNLITAPCIISDDERPVSLKLTNDVPCRTIHLPEIPPPQTTSV